MDNLHSFIPGESTAAALALLAITRRLPHLTQGLEKVLECGLADPAVAIEAKVLLIQSCRYVCMFIGGEVVGKTLVK